VLPVAGKIVLVTDHSSAEGSEAVVAAAVELLTGTPPILIDARHFMPGGSGWADVEGGTLRLKVPSEDLIVRPSGVLIYDIAPTERRLFGRFRRLLARYGAVSLDADRDSWRNATEKDRTVRRFLRDGIRHMETISLRRPSQPEVLEAFERLGKNVWARPTIGSGGRDVFHITGHDELYDAFDYYAKSEFDWLLSRDAKNFNQDHRRHQFRIVVLGHRVLRICEHVQADPDAPCNEAQGAVSTILREDEIGPGLLQLAVSATKSLGLPFGGVDLAVENDGVVFEVNVHPVLDVPGGLESVAVPWVEAHLALFRSPGAGFSQPR
jgi:glutathione synthase/RimK-type ligase-like ATP-grasp enzyme